VLGVVGHVDTIDPREFELFDGVQEAVRVSEPYKLTSRTWKREKTVVTARGVEIGGDKVVVMAGPCTIESEPQLFETARRVARSGAKVLRGGAYKPRTSPYAFQGMGVEGLKLLRAAGDETNMATVSEVMDISQIEGMLEYVDILQVGARNMQNFNLLSALGPDSQAGAAQARHVGDDSGVAAGGRSTSWPAATTTSSSASAASGRSRLTPRTRSTSRRSR
jgi:3-deoxy-7-phosphoheptulonate synthase